MDPDPRSFFLLDPDPGEKKRKITTEKIQENWFSYMIFYFFLLKKTLYKVILYKVLNLDPDSH